MLPGHNCGRLTNFFAAVYSQKLMDCTVFKTQVKTEKETSEKETAK